MLQRQLQCILVNYSVHPNSYSSGISSPSLAFPIASISVAVQGTANASLHETWIKYEEMFNCLDEVKRAFNAMGTRPTWIQEIHSNGDREDVVQALRLLLQHRTSIRFH